MAPVPELLAESVFIGEILRGSRHGLLLDVTNLRINAVIFGSDSYAWLEPAPLEHTVCIHVSGDEQYVGGSRDGKAADMHGQPVPDSSGRMVEGVVAQVPVKGILLELGARIGMPSPPSARTPKVAAT